VSIAALLSRILAACLGGYALAVAFSLAFALAWPGAKAEGVMIGLIGSFAIGTVAVIWVFAVSTAWRAWIGLLIAAAILAGVAWLGGGAP